jgi:hypothetical protein
MLSFIARLEDDSLQALFLAISQYKGVYQDVCLRVSIDYEANSQRRAVGPAL